MPKTMRLLLFTMMAMAALVLVMEFALVDTVRMQKKGKTRTKYSFRAEKMHYKKSILPDVFPERGAKQAKQPTVSTAHRNRKSLQALKARYDADPKAALQQIAANASETSTIQLWSLLQHEKRPQESKAIVDALAACEHPSAAACLTTLAASSGDSVIRQHARNHLSKSDAINR